MEKLQVNGLQFSYTLCEILMQATTINPMNIYFPGGSNVYMETLNGGIDWKYPTFPTADAKTFLATSRSAG
jgi:hypothetical protein